MQSDIQKLKDLIKDIKVSMLTTVSEAGDLHSRPMMSQELDEEGSLWYFTSSETGKSMEIDRESNVNVAFSEPKDQKYISIAGSAEMIEDRAKAKELWNPAMKAWFPDGVEQADLRLIKVKIESAEYWDAPNGKMVQLVGMIKAAVTGQPYRASKGENDKLNLRS